jgi:hypothetical protein
LVHQPRADSSGFLVKFSVGDVEFFIFAINEECESSVMRAVCRSLTQKVNDGWGEGTFG